MSAVRDLAVFALIGSTLFALQRVWARPEEAPLRVLVALHEDPARAVDDALLIDVALAHGAHAADPIVREELLRSMRGIPGGRADDDQALLAGALALDLHLHDRVVRERLRFAGEELLLEAAPEQASDEALRAYYTAHRARYDMPALFSVELDWDAPAALLARRLLGVTESTLAQRIGAEPARTVLALDDDAWSPRLDTPYGPLRARVLARSPAEAAQFTDVRARVAADLTHDARATRLADRLTDLRRMRTIVWVRAAP